MDSGNLPTLSAKEQERRRAVMRDALAQVRLEGLEPDPIFFDYEERYIRGELTIQDAIADYARRVRTRRATA